MNQEEHVALVNGEEINSSATSRTVDVYLSKLREKTKNCDGFEIQTVHGLGYKVVLK